MAPVHATAATVRRVAELHEDAERHERGGLEDRDGHVPAADLGVGLAPADQAVEEARSAEDAGGADEDCSAADAV